MDPSYHEMKISHFIHEIFCNLFLMSIPLFCFVLTDTSKLSIFKLAPMFTNFHHPFGISNHFQSPRADLSQPLIFRIFCYHLLFLKLFFVLILFKRFFLRRFFCQRTFDERARGYQRLWIVWRLLGS